LSRNLAFIATLMDSNVEFIAADNPHANRLTVHILAAVAEHERGAISERTKVALAAAKRRGVKRGSPRLAAARKASIKARSEAADAFAANVRPIIKEIQASGVCSMRGIARALAARGVKTPVVVIGATCRSPPSCGARHCPPPLFLYAAAGRGPTRAGRAGR